MSKFLPSFLFLILLLGSASAYYANIDVFVNSDGSVQITGVSDHPMLKAGTYQDFTSKDGAVWLLNLSPDGIFSDFSARIHFPEASAVNYLMVPSVISMGQENGRLTVTTVGSNRGFFAVAQYTIGATPADWTYAYAAGILAIAALMVFIAFRLRKKKLPYNPLALTDRQKEIVDFISKKGGHALQSDLQSATCLPKVSLSRNLDSLEKKGIVTRERKGMSNIVFLKR